MRRREFLGLLLKGGLWTFSLGMGPSLLAMGESSKFVFAQLEYRGGNWNSRPRAARRLVWELVKRTSIEASLDTVNIRPHDPIIFEYPFIYMAGDQEFEPFDEKERENLKRYIEFGGTLLADDSLGKQGFGFDRSLRREITSLFPGQDFVKLPEDHTVYRSFYLISQPGGRILSSPYLEGLNIEGRTAIIYSQNDLGGAWAKDSMGNWEYEVLPGGEVQRTTAFRLGINIILYALTGDYKQDQVHLPFILRRQM